MTRSVAKSPRVAEQCDVNVYSLTGDQMIVVFFTGPDHRDENCSWSTRRVAGQVDHSECAVRNCWEQWTRESTHAPKTGSGATRNTTRSEDQRIVRQALVDPTVTRSTIRAEVGVAIVPQTISRHLSEANLKSKRPFRALPLTSATEWCQDRSMWNVTDWQKVVFSDESRFVLGTDDNRVRVWRRPGERYNSPHTVLRHTARTAGVMVWGSIAYDSRSTLIVMRGTLTDQRYVDDILRPHVGTFLNGTPGAIFQQDNVAAVAEWYRYRTVACFVTGSGPVPLKTRRVGQRCTLNLSRAETSSRWCGVVVRRGGCQLRCRPRHLTMVQNYVQDNARLHTARVAQDFLCHFQTLPWPARSPDSSPVVHVWDQLKRQMPSCHSLHDLELAVQDLWAHLPQDNIRCLINLCRTVWWHVLQLEVVQHATEVAQYLCRCTPCIRSIVLFLRSSESLICVNMCIKFHFNPMFSSWVAIFNVPECTIFGVHCGRPSAILRVLVCITLKGFN
ncbi:transposable element Tcb1 transposase [Trichonephila clavipes]|nr:transposable element Tcb1 transposase [Trichonephila clavipes]